MWPVPSLSTLLNSNGPVLLDGFDYGKCPGRCHHPHLRLKSLLYANLPITGRIGLHDCVDIAR